MVEGEEECHDKIVETAIEVPVETFKTNRKISKESGAKKILAYFKNESIFVRCLKKPAVWRLRRSARMSPPASPRQTLALKVILANIPFPQLVPQQECRQVPKEVCQTVFLNPRNVKVSLAFSMEGFASQCRAVPSPGHATGAGKV